jgi:uncharacterized protein YlbG (UPF0298 family)
MNPNLFQSIFKKYWSVQYVQREKRYIDLYVERETG